MLVFGVVGRCAAKAGVVSRLVAGVTARGLLVSTIKRVNDRVDLDRPGTSSWGQRAAGAHQVVLASGTRIAVLQEAREPAEDPDLAALLASLAPVDLVLLEGFRGAVYPKLEVVEPGQDRRLQALDDPSVVAVASAAPAAAPVRFFDVEDTDGLVAFVLEHAAPVA
jgi:molybdopterin-guanine dinucleotide biosynthesis protein MobB